MIEHALRLVSSEAKKNQISMEIDAGKEIAQTEVDPDKIKQVLLNIFLNALAALQNGGKITVRLSADAENLTVVISDNGAGIERTDLPRIYDPYFTSKPAGTGLGLAIVQKIMEAHGGRINIESAAGKGTDVFLTFPLS